MVQKAEERGKEALVYTAGDIMVMLGIGRTKAYDLLDSAYKTQKPFRVIKVGKCVRVPKKSFDRWFSGVEREV